MSYYYRLFYQNLSNLTTFHLTVQKKEHKKEKVIFCSLLIIKKILKRKGNRKTFTQLLKLGLNEEVEQRNNGLDKKDLLEETLLLFSNNLDSTKKIKARTFFRVFARIALDHHDYWLTPEELYETLIK